MVAQLRVGVQSLETVNRNCIHTQNKNDIPNYFITSFSNLVGICVRHYKCKGGQEHNNPVRHYILCWFELSSKGYRLTTKSSESFCILFIQVPVFYFRCQFSRTELTAHMASRTRYCRAWLVDTNPSLQAVLMKTATHSRPLLSAICWGVFPSLSTACIHACRGGFGTVGAILVT